MQKTKYPDALKQQALHILAESGTAEASRQTGIPIGTIASWGHRLGVKAPTVDKIAQVVAQAEVTWSRRRVQLGERLGVLAGAMAGRIEERIEGNTVSGVRDLAASMAVVIDRAQLLTGGATSRSEIVERTPEAEAEVAKVLELVRTQVA